MTTKIALLSSTWLHDYTTTLLNGILERIESEDVVVHVFNIYDFVEKNDVYEDEQEILRLTDLNQYDGLLIAFTAIGTYPILTDIIQKFTKTGKRVLCIDQSFASQPCIGIDNYASYYQLVEHMITVHHCHTINFIGGPTDNQDSRLRYQAVCDCMQKHSLLLETDRVANCSFLNSDGQRIYKLWKEKGLHLPDAVLCANDGMALGYCMAAMEDGHKIPDDFLLAGFDNVNEAEHFSPTITSINRNWKQLGYESISRLLDLIHGAPVQPRYYINGILKCNESCGCCSSVETVAQNLSYLYEQHTRESVYDTWNRDVLQRFCSVNTLQEFSDALTHAEAILEIPHLSLCLNYSENSTLDTLYDDYTDSFIVFAQGYHEIIPRSQLLPNALLYVNAKIYFFSPIHFRKKNFGYCVMPYANGLLDYNRHKHFIENISLALETLSQRRLLSSVNHRLQELYVRDQLTGLYNRFGYHDIATIFFEKYHKNVCLYYIDADNLKYINDNLGHTYGDKAIISIAEGMRTVFSEEAVLVRMGGDEFLVLDVMLPEEEAAGKVRDFDRYLTVRSDEIGLPCPLSVSIGYIRNTDASAILENLVHNADTIMYQTKQAKKAKLAKNKK